MKKYDSKTPQYITVLSLALLMNACSSSSNTDQEPENKTVVKEFTTDDSSYFAVETVTGWQKIPAGKAVSFSVNNGLFRSVQACLDLNRVVVVYNDSKVDKKLFDFSCSSESMRFSSILYKSSKVKLPIGASEQDVRRFIVVDGNDLSSPVSVTSTLSMSPSNGKLYWDNLSSVSELENLEIDFTSTEKVLDYSEQYTLSIKYPSNLAKENFSVLGDVFTNLYIEQKEYYYLAIQSSKNHINIPKIFKSGENITSYPFLNINFLYQEEVGGAKIEFNKGYRSVDLEYVTELEFNFTELPNMPSVLFGQFEGDDLVITAKPYDANVDGFERSNISAGVTVGSTELKTEWGINSIPFDGNTGFEVKIPDGTELPEFPEKFMTLKKSGFVFSDATVSYAYDYNDQNGNSMRFVSSTPILNNL